MHILHFQKLKRWSHLTMTVFLYFLHSSEPHNYIIPDFLLTQCSANFHVLFSQYA